MNKIPAWLQWAERHMGWLAIPRLGTVLVVVQAMGFLLLWFKAGSDAYLVNQLTNMLTLRPEAVWAGEFWRIFTFLAVPLSYDIWMIFVLWFLYFVLNSLSHAWGDFKLTVYFLISWIGTVLASLFLGVYVDNFWFIETTFFFALASLIPNHEILFFLVLPIKMKWIALFSAAIMIAVPLLLGDWAYRIYLMVACANYLLFFGPGYVDTIRQEMRRRKAMRGS